MVEKDDPRTETRENPAGGAQCDAPQEGRPGTERRAARALRPGMGDRGQRAPNGICTGTRKTTGKIWRTRFEPRTRADRGSVWHASIARRDGIGGRQCARLRCARAAIRSGCA